MGIMDRLSRLIRANVNDLIDRAEDPEKLLDQILRDMQTNITSARAQVASMIAQEKELEADLGETRRLAIEWGAKAQRAVEAGKDDLAREALRRKRDNEGNAQVYQQQYQVQQQAVDKLKDQLRQLEAKYQATLSQRDSLIARQRRAKAQREVAESLNVSVFTPLDSGSELERMERQIRGTEAQAMAALEVGETGYEAQFRELDLDVGIEDELAALKAGVTAGQLPAETTGDDGR
ncbi:MAG: PspA/IM30 family protein [Chloroflexota bacterium]|nr:PspA/IM30 family protein [Chloroflexota bacterium]